MSNRMPLENGPKNQPIARPIPTRPYWDEAGLWRCVCTTPTHRRGQRFTQQQCTYCEYVLKEDS